MKRIVFVKEGSAEFPEGARRRREGSGCIEIDLSDRNLIVKLRYTHAVVWRFRIYTLKSLASRCA